MPKDAKKNVDRYKIRGGDLNEFEFTQNQAAFVAEQTVPTSLIPGTPPEAKALRAEELAKKAQKRSPKKPAKAASKKAAGTKKSSKRASGKKSAAKKATKKRATKK